VRIEESRFRQYLTALAGFQMDPGRAARYPFAMKKGDHLFLVDGSGYIFRAYHALPPLNRKSDGLPTNAVARLLQHAVEADAGCAQHRRGRDADAFRGDLRLFVEDVPQRTLPEYKANRSAPPEDLIPQFGLIRQATRPSTCPASRWKGSRPTT
jgi:DNA polymerase-1